MQHIKGVLLDLSGTLHIGDTSTREAVASLQLLYEHGIPVRFCSNTSKESRTDLIARLTRIGFTINQPEHLFTSLSTAKDLVLAEKLNPLLLLSHSAKMEFPSFPTEGKNAVVIGLSNHSYNDVNEAFRLLQQSPSSRLIATHKAEYYRAEDGHLSLGPGGFVSMLESASGKSATVVGKPMRTFLESALASLGMKGEDVAIVGDDIKNDLGGDVGALGLHRVLVKTGKYRDGDEDKGKIESVFEDFKTFVDALIAERSKAPPSE